MLSQDSISILYPFGNNDVDVNVWHDAHDKDFQVVIPCAGRINTHAVHVCIYVAVHAQLGLVFWQFVTGTTSGWQAVIWPGTHGAEERKDPNWQVRGRADCGGMSVRNGRHEQNAAVGCYGVGGAKGGFQCATRLELCRVNYAIGQLKHC